LDGRAVDEDAAVVVQRPQADALWRHHQLGVAVLHPGTMAFVIDDVARTFSKGKKTADG